MLTPPVSLHHPTRIVDTSGTQQSVVQEEHCTFPWVRCRYRRCQAVRDELCDLRFGFVADGASPAQRCTNDRKFPPVRRRQRRAAIGLPHHFRHHRPGIVVLMFSTIIQAINQGERLHKQRWRLACLRDSECVGAYKFYAKLGPDRPVRRIETIFSASVRRIIAPIKSKILSAP